MSVQYSRTIVVTGASRGLGLEWVRQLSDDGQNLVVAIVRNPENAKQSETLLRSNVAVVKGDLSDLDSFSALAAEISKVGGGKVDILINNAGVMIGTGAEPQTGISKSTPEEWSDQVRQASLAAKRCGWEVRSDCRQPFQFNVNVISLVFFTIAMLPLLENGRDKKVVNLASMLGDVGFALASPELHFSSYAVTKAAVTMANAKFHVEFKDKGFTFLALNPGWVNTDLAGKGKGVYAPLQPEDSIRQCLNFVYRSELQHSGKFFSLDGRPEAVTI
ncbi:Putative oxidoreductase [Tolypocladium paradoxum]|uniref:Oxidoreductase n=1 Tax=Tolypocladium paradoxum TaxID=94208 RepID=A0A2S4KW59_9HYPO|nr:Putative oxidoreductase [Tolypocladium paradoxum]